MSINTNKQLIDTIAEEVTSITKDQIWQVLKSLGDTAANTLQQDKEIVLPGIGKLKPAQRAARVGRNPQTGEAIQIPAKRVVKLTVSKKLTDHLNS